MSKLVKVYDDVVPDYIANQIEYLTLGKENIFPWFYSTSLTFDENQKDFKFEPGIKHLIYNKEHKHYSKFIFHLSYPLYSFCLKENFLLQRVFQIRSFCHLPTPDPKPTGNLLCSRSSPTASMISSPKGREPEPKEARAMANFGLEV